MMCETMETRDALAHPQGAPLGAAVTLRTARPEEAPALRALHELSLALLAGTAYTPKQVHGLFSVLDTVDPGIIGSGRMFVAERYGIIVASGGWTQKPTPEAGPDQLSIHLRSIFVHPLQTRRGIATAMVRHVEADARRHAALETFTLDATLNAAPLYRSLGYRDVARRDFPVGDGVVFPLVRMRRTCPRGERSLGIATDARTGIPA